VATKKLDPLDERISALPDEPPKRAVPPTYPGRLGFGKVLVPAQKPVPPVLPRPDRHTPAKPPPGEPWRPKSAPIHELTEPGVAPPAPGSAPQPRRSFSPPPAASEAELRAIEREAQSEGARVVLAPESRPAMPKRSYSPPPVEQSFRREYGIEAGTRNWIIVILGMTGLTGGVAVYGAVRTPPAAVQEAPKKLDDQQKDLSRVRDDVAECRADLRETESDVKRLQRRTDSLERKLYEIEKSVPKVNP
jgi:hypothetical protein